jgi:anti-sigma factor RsiW
MPLTPYTAAKRKRTRRCSMFRSIPIFAIAMTAGVAAILFSGLRPPEAAATVAKVELDVDEWFI